MAKNLIVQLKLCESDLQ